MQDKRALLRTHEYLLASLEDFSDNCVLIHGNFCLRSTLKDSRSDQLLMIVGPGLMLWTPRECELFRLIGNSLVEDLLWGYLQCALVTESFVWRRWLYVPWDEATQLANIGRLSRRSLDLASKSPLLRLV